MLGTVELLGGVPYEAALCNNVRPRALREQLGRTACRLQSEIGAKAGLKVYLFGDLAGLAMVQQANQANGFEPLLPLLVPALAPAAECLWVGLADETGILATAAAVYAYIPAGRSLRGAIEDLSLFLKVPEAAQSLGARAVCSAPTAGQVSGHVVTLAGGWVHPRLRGKGLISKVVHLAAIAAYAKHAPDWIAGFIAFDLPMKLTFNGYGFPRREALVELTLPGWPVEQFTLNLMTRAEAERGVIGFAPERAAASEGAYQAALGAWARAMHPAQPVAEAAE